ncbi:mycothione reductase [Pseudonocardia petroleophila]|uniref:Mycothione reductase n=1 Tax=Pseudonocardia petroleophila TaxID=37331 RepID=A0A7G7MHW0_9PSEU|nr:mycothione reductase [Pseudonocardia petroleophila]QNG52371.1 mycothione reductase [Pseudonocardia petroleophila]
MRHHDLAVIGTGSGNSIVDPRFDHLDVAIVEHGVFGGTCLNVGCIPTKMYVYPADVARLIRKSSTYGIDASVDKVRWTDIRDRVFGRIDPISAGGREYRVDRCPNVTVYEGHARFTGPREISVDGGEPFSADRIVIAAGGRPAIPQPITDSGIPYETSDTIMRIDTLPEHLLVVGAGYIGAEFAHVFSALGSRVTIIGRGRQLLRSQDETVAERFTDAVRDRWDVRLGQSITTARHGADGIELTFQDGSSVRGDLVLVATGRKPNSDRLDLDRAGIAVHVDGRIAVDEHQRTSVDGVFALGDISSPYQLKHVANHEAKVVAHNLAHPDDLRATNHHAVPAAVFTDPQIAAVGRTEAQCRAEGLDVAVKIQAYGDVAYGWAMEDTTGFCKIIAERGTGRILGAHVMGPQASTVIQPLVQAMAFGLGAREMAEGQYWIHPALPEVVENALLGLDL